MKQKLLSLIALSLIFCVSFGQNKNSTVKISSNIEGAVIKFNNTVKGTAPCNISVAPGTYTIIAEKVLDEFERWYFKTKITVKATEIKQLNLKLKKEYIPLIDSRDGKTYKTVKLGTKLWMAENLNYATDGSYFYTKVINGKTKTIGHTRLYTRSSAKTSCPVGWHLPTREKVIVVCFQK